ncbi:MAG: histidinol-phosphate transaminase [Planctomycetota bacterium]|nr:histidinol-phosphate transaminase [Planctomycetota bacterium]
MSLFRPNIDAMDAYKPGEQPPAGARVIKLNTNENPYPPSPKVAEAIEAELKAGAAPGERLRLYSDPMGTELRKAASEATGFPVEQILHGNGSDELLAMLLRAFVDPGEAVAYPYPTYVLYETLAHAQGAKIRTFDFPRDFALPEGLFGCGAKLVFVASPNSPSGTVYPAGQLAELADSLKRGILVVDEAYVEFADANALELARAKPNVVVTRTFSKSHSLAGMRLGLLYAPAPLVAGLVKVKDSYNLDRLSIVAGAAALRDPAWTKANVERVRATRARLARALADLGLEVLPSQSNFLFARLPGARAAERAAGAYRFLKEHGILIRYFPARLLDDGIRVSVGTEAEVDAFLERLKEYLARG